MKLLPDLKALRKLLPDLNKVQSWVHIAISLILFSWFQIKLSRDRVEQATTVKVVESKMEHKIDSIRNQQQQNTARITQIARQNRELVEIVVTLSDENKKINKQLFLLKISEKNALKRIDKMDNSELLEYFKSLKEVEK